MVQFGKLHVNLDQGEVCHNGLPLRVGSRAAKILELLIEANGAMVSKDEFISRVWPSTIVEENNLQVQVAGLRKALGEDRELIKTIPGRGYRLVASMKDALDELQFEVHRAFCELPIHVKLVGREAAVGDIAATVQRVPLLTLIGAGGIGKTSLAICVARRVLSKFRGGVRFVELAAVSDPGTVLLAVAEACHIRLSGGAVSVSRIAKGVADEPCLLVFDNAEHVVDVIARLVAALIPGHPHIRILVTSREPLQITGESLFRVHPLDVPAVDAPVDKVLASSAVQLFVRQARALACDFRIDERTIRLVGDICRRLDGIPLAIELAAARSAALGVAGVYCRLDERLQLLAGGHRNALPRHQTLRATFEWSYGLLDPASRTMFRRLGIFAGVFSFEAVCAVVTDPDTPVASVVTSISELTGKSLLSVEFDGAVALYRLPESTRAYAMEKLRHEGEVQRIAMRYVQLLRERFDGGTKIGVRSNEREVNAERRQVLDEARSTFDWAFSAEGDPKVGIVLAASFVYALLEGSLVGECCERAARAVEAIDNLPLQTVDPRCEVKLRGALAATLLHTKGAVIRAEQLWQEVLVRACETDDNENQARALLGLWHTMLAGGDINSSLRYAARYQQVAAGNGNELQRAIGDQLISVTLHCMGEHEQARERLEHGLVRLTALRYEGADDGYFAVDPLIFSNGTLARISWMQGFPDEALEQVEMTIKLVRADALEPSLSHILATVAVPLVLMSGDLHAAARYLEVLRSQVALHGFVVWREYCEALAAQVDIMNGQAELGVMRLEAALDALLARGFRRLLTPAITVCAETLASQGRIADAVARLDEALEYCNSHGEHFFMPEVWRVMGVVTLAEAHLARGNGRLRETHETRALRCLLRAIEIAREQGARMWELRASLVLAKLLSVHGHREKALDLLNALAAHFDARSGASDIRALYALLGELKPHHSAAQRVGELESDVEVSLACQPPPSDL